MLRRLTIMFMLTFSLLAISVVAAQDEAHITTLAPGETGRVTSRVSGPMFSVTFTIAEPGYYTFRARGTGADVLGLELKVDRDGVVSLGQDLASAGFTRFVDIFLIPGDYTMEGTIQQGRIVDVSLMPAVHPLLGAGRHDVFEIAVPQGDIAEIDFDFAAGEIITLRAATLTRGFNPEIALVDEEGLIYALNDNRPNFGSLIDRTLGINDSLIDTFVVPATRTYTLRVYTAGSVEGDVLVTASRHGQIDLAADAIEREVVELDLPGFETLTHNVSITAGEVVRLSLIAADPESLDPILNIVDANQNRIASNDDHLGGDADLSTLDSQVLLFARSDADLTALVGAFSGSGKLVLHIDRFGQFTLIDGD